MNLSKKLLTLLAIFCMIASAGVVCAEEDGGLIASQHVVDEGIIGDNGGDFSGWAGSQYNDTDGGWAGSQYQDDGGWAGSQYNETAEHAAGEPVNQTVQNATSTAVAHNATENATGNDTANAASPSTMLATGNPIFTLFTLCAVLGGYAIFKRN